jgi:C1A family cysteine protease
MRPLLPPARDQGSRGTCAAFAVTAAHELARSAGAIVSDDLSEEALYWGCKVIDGNWRDGTRLTSASSALSATGQPYEAVWPYDPRRLPGIAYAPPTALTPGWHMSDMKQVPVDLAAVRAQLDVGVPVVLAITVFGTLFQPSTAGRIEAPATGSPSFGRHAVLAVGHDGDALLIRNSWGQTWALAGYAWLSSEYAQHHVAQAWVI